MTGILHSSADRSAKHRIPWSCHRWHQLDHQQLSAQQHRGVDLLARIDVWVGRCLHLSGELSQALSDGNGNLSSESRDISQSWWKLIAQTAYTAPSQWFDKKRGLCTGIASCGAGLGGAVYSVVSEAYWCSWLDQES